jgi:hypothetical protein
MTSWHGGADQPLEQVALAGAAIPGSIRMPV